MTRIQYPIWLSSPEILNWESQMATSTGSFRLQKPILISFCSISKLLYNQETATDQPWIKNLSNGE